MSGYIVLGFASSGLLPLYVTTALNDAKSFVDKHTGFVATKLEYRCKINVLTVENISHGVPQSDVVYERRFA